MNPREYVRRAVPVRHHQLAKFLIVGGAAYCVDAVLFVFLSHTLLSAKVLTAKVISVLVSTVVSYVLNREWSFSERDGRETPHEALLFFVVNAVALGLNLIPLAVTRYAIGVQVPAYSQTTVSITDFVAANVVGTAIGMAFRFWAYRRFVFLENPKGRIS